MYVIFTLGVANDSGMSTSTPILEEGFNLCKGIELAMVLGTGAHYPTYIVDSETGDFGMYYNGGWAGELTPNE
jgi:hypothetical protein